MKKRLAAAVMAVVMALSATVTVFAGAWDYDEGYWYFYDSPEGYDDGEDDELITGWQWIDGYCYYLDPIEDGAMAFDTITADGFPVDEIGRMTDYYGEPYYIPGWGRTSTTAGPGDYDYYLENEEYYGSPTNYALSRYFDLDILEDIRRRNRDRGRDKDRRRNTPDTVIILVNGQQPDNAGEQPKDAQDQTVSEEGLPENPVIRAGGEEKPSEGAAEQPEKKEDVPENPVIRAGGEEKQSESAAEEPEKKEEQPENPVIRAGGDTSQSENAEKQQTQRPASRPQRSQNGIGSASNGTGSASASAGNASADTGSASTGTGSASSGTGSASAGTGRSSAGNGSNAAGTGRASAGSGSNSAGTGRAQNGNASRGQNGSQNIDPNWWFLLGLE